MSLTPPGISIYQHPRRGIACTQHLVSSALARGGW